MLKFTNFSSVGTLRNISLHIKIIVWWYSLYKSRIFDRNLNGIRFRKWRKLQCIFKKKKNSPLFKTILTPAIVYRYKNLYYFYLLRHVFLSCSHNRRNVAKKFKSYNTCTNPLSVFSLLASFCVDIGQVSAIYKNAICALKCRLTSIQINFELQHLL